MGLRRMEPVMWTQGVCVSLCKCIALNANSCQSHIYVHASTILNEVVHYCL